MQAFRPFLDFRRLVQANWASVVLPKCGKCCGKSAASATSPISPGQCAVLPELSRGAIVKHRTPSTL